MRIAHLTASPFFGGPERQLLGLALHMPRQIQSSFISFPEGGLCRPFLTELQQRGFTAEALRNNAPHCLRAIRELRQVLQQQRAELLCCHGYKADLFGLPAARMLGLPIVSISRGWTGASWKVRLSEGLDRLSLWLMDKVVCVSEGQARKVRRVGIPERRIRVIRNAISTQRFRSANAQGRAFLDSFFRQPPRFLIGSAGRLSPEKGFSQLVAAAAQIRRIEPGAGFLLFGNGPLREDLTRQIAQLGLQDHFMLADFRSDLDRWLPNFDVFTLPSYTEGLPNVVLEALAARVPVVATAVGGTPEVIEEGQNGYLVPAGQPQPLAQRIGELLRDERLRAAMGASGHRRVSMHFTFEAQAQQYVQLFQELLSAKTSPATMQVEALSWEASSPAA